MKKNSIYVAILVAGMLASCGGSSDTTTGASTEQTAAASALTLESLVDTDLTSQGIPVTIKAPKDAKISKGSGETELIVDGGDNFKIEVRATKSSDITESINTQKEMVSDTSLYPSFEKFELNEPQGYVKKSTSGEKTFYYAVKLNAEGGYVTIKNEVMSTFTPEAIDLMYQAAKLAKATDAK